MFIKPKFPMDFPGKFYDCDCYTEALRISFDDETGMFDISVWYHGKYRHSLWWRIKVALRVLFKGEPYGDQIILSYEAAQHLAQDIQGVPVKPPADK